uniref:Putative ovule protein n=1 Tax=Solanum chacoense TaxID=4108 RepID=A0A0V0H9N9_SOLCH
MRRAGMVCEHCGYKGHTKDTCYRIIGFPADFKSKRKAHHEGSTPYANNSTMETGNNSGSSTSHGEFFTREQCDQLLSMLPLAPTGNCRTDAAGPFKWEGDWDW